MRPFETPDDAAYYLTGDTIECLLCGRHFQALNRHLRFTHKMHPDEYKARFGIPFDRSLTSGPGRDKRRARLTRAQIERYRGFDGDWLETPPIHYARPI